MKIICKYLVPRIEGFAPEQFNAILPDLIEKLANRDNLVLLNDWYLFTIISQIIPKLMIYIKRNMLEENETVSVNLASVAEGLKNDSLMMSITFEYKYKYLLLLIYIVVYFVHIYVLLFVICTVNRHCCIGCFIYAFVVCAVHVYVILFAFWSIIWPQRYPPPAELLCQVCGMPAVDPYVTPYHIGKVFCKTCTEFESQAGQKFFVCAFYFEDQVNILLTLCTESQ